MNIKHQILDKIKKYQTIVIFRHFRPDMDAIGSQYGLALVLKENFKEKEIYVVGDTAGMTYNAEMDLIDDAVFQNALAIIVDVAVSHMVSDERYTLAKERIIIDHHQNDSNIEYDIYYRDPSFGSAAEMIIDLIKTHQLKVTKEAATYLYGGMVTDTGRFMFLNKPTQTFALAAYICEFEPNIQDFYDYVYTETLKKRQTKNLFANFEVTEHGVAYRKNEHELILQSGLEFQTVSRGMVNQMAGIKEIPIWANFTEDIENNVVIGEFRSRGITIVDIAKKYGGGGHDQACGASLNNWDEVEQILKDLDERAKQHGTHIKIDSNL
jgi:bifunctional oligoribonuclease and PAP phosphatase NrnA